jgi:hypothetical protein
MSIENVTKQLVEFGFKDCSKEWNYKPSTNKIAFGYQDAHFIEFDPEEIKYSRKSGIEDTSKELTRAQYNGLCAYIMLDDILQEELQEPKLHLNKLYEDIVTRPNEYRYKRYKEFKKQFEIIKRKDNPNLKYKTL